MDFPVDSSFCGLTLSFVYPNACEEFAHEDTSEMFGGRCLALVGLPSIMQRSVFDLDLMLCYQIFLSAVNRWFPRWILSFGVKQ